MNADIPMITGRELEYAPPGLYIMQAAPGQPYTTTSDMAYDVQKDEWVEGPHTLILMARVRDADGRPLPKGQFDAYVRSDGRQVIKAYQTPPQD